MKDTEKKKRSEDRNKINEKFQMKKTTTKSKTFPDLFLFSSSFAWIQSTKCNNMRNNMRNNMSNESMEYKSIKSSLCLCMGFISNNVKTGPQVGVIVPGRVVSVVETKNKLSCIVYWRDSDKNTQTEKNNRINKNNDNDNHNNNNCEIIADRNSKTKTVTTKNENLFFLRNDKITIFDIFSLECLWNYEIFSSLLPLPHSLPLSPPLSFLSPRGTINIFSAFMPTNISTFSVLKGQNLEFNTTLSAHDLFGHLSSVEVEVDTKKGETHTSSLYSSSLPSSTSSSSSSSSSKIVSTIAIWGVPIKTHPPPKAISNASFNPSTSEHTDSGDGSKIPPLSLLGCCMLPEYGTSVYPLGNDKLLFLSEKSGNIYVLGWLTENQMENDVDKESRDEKLKINNSKIGKNMNVPSGEVGSTYASLTGNLKSSASRSKVRIGILCKYELEYVSSAIMEVKCTNDKVILSLATGGVDIFYLISKKEYGHIHVDDNDSDINLNEDNKKINEIRNNDNDFYLLKGPCFSLPSSLLTDLKMFPNENCMLINQFLSGNIPKYMIGDMKTNMDIDVDTETRIFKNANASYNNNDNNDNNDNSINYNNNGNNHNNTSSNLMKNSNYFSIICVDRMDESIIIICISLPTTVELITKQKHNSQLIYKNLEILKKKMIVTTDGNRKNYSRNINIKNVFNIIPVSTTFSSTSFWILNHSCIFEYVSTPLISTLTVLPS